MTQPNQPQVVLFDVIEPHIALVTINRPEARNAVNGAVAAGLGTTTRTMTMGIAKVSGNTDAAPGNVVQVL